MEQGKENQEGAQEVPSPKGLGEGFALEVGKTYITRDGRWKAKITGFVPGSDSHWPFVGMWIGGDPTYDPGIRYATFPTWNESGAIFHEPRPTDLVAEAPSPDAAGVPEAKPKGPSPSEVPQPGEGVDLEDGVGAELADYFERLGIREERQAWVNTLYPEKLRLLAMTLGQRALRRESK